MLINGRWSEDDGKSRGEGGKFDHLPTCFHHRITEDGSSGFRSESGRYFLYVSRTCPWAHRTIIFRHLKGLADDIGLIMVRSGEEGYEIERDDTKLVPGTDLKITNLHELYSLSNKKYTGRVTVPALWDAKTCKIVNNESSEIIEMLNNEFNEIGGDNYDYFPENLKTEIRTINNMVYHKVNNGVYKAGFSTSQEAYEDAYEGLFEAFDTMEKILGKQRYLAGSMITGADWRAFPTLYRFDTVYHYAFKCNKKHLYEYPNLWNYTKDLYQMPGISDICWLEAAKGNYWTGSRVSATGTIPKGPEGIDFLAPHDRTRFR